MDENTTPQEVLTLVEKAQSKGVFDIAAFAKGRSLPQDSVTAYLNVDAAYRLNKLNQEMTLVLDPKELAVHEAKAKELSAEILASKVVFLMRGITQEQIEQITKLCDKNNPAEENPFGQKTNSQEWLREWTIRLVAANLVKTENAEGEVDERVFEYEDAEALFKHLPKEVWDLLVEKMEQLTLATAYFKGLTDAGFLPKS